MTPGLQEKHHLRCFSPRFRALGPWLLRRRPSDLTCAVSAFCCWLLNYFTSVCPFSAHSPICRHQQSGPAVGIGLNVAQHISDYQQTQGAVTFLCRLRRSQAYLFRSPPVPGTRPSPTRGAASHFFMATGARKTVAAVSSVVSLYASPHVESQPFAAPCLGISGRLASLLSFLPATFDLFV